MSRSVICAIGAMTAVLLCGCGRSALPHAREMGDMALMRTMGVDAGEDGKMVVTVSSGERAVGLKGDTQPSLVLSAERDSLSGACLAIQSLSDSYIFYGYVDQLLLGEELALGGVERVLDYLSRDVELGLGTQIWLVQDGTAQDGVQAGGESGVEERLSILQNNSEMGVAGLTRTAGEVFQDLLEWGGSYLPALQVVESQQEGETALLENGYGILKGGQLVGYLEEEEARGLELLLGESGSDLLEFQLDSGLAAARITDAELVCAPVFREGQLESIGLTCRITADLVEFQAPIQPEELEVLRQRIEEQEGARMAQVLEQLRRWKVDCVGLGSQVSMAAPAGWQKIEDTWESLFGVVPMEVTVQVTVERAYGDLA